VNRRRSSSVTRDPHDGGGGRVAPRFSPARAHTSSVRSDDVLTPASTTASRRVGMSEMRLMTPRNAFWPYSTEPGPRTISILSNCGSDARKSRSSERKCVCALISGMPFERNSSVLCRPWFKIVEPQFGR
jgi:hypothetical protein